MAEPPSPPQAWHVAAMPGSLDVLSARHAVRASPGPRTRLGWSGDTRQASRSSHLTEHKHGGLGELPATAICGNDITSCCLYVSALAIIYAGPWAPVVLLMVAGLLYLFRSIYAEVIGALPLNGGHSYHDRRHQLTTSRLLYSR